MQACVLQDATEDLKLYFFQLCAFVMYSIVFVAALVGNGLVCYVVQTIPYMKTVTNYFIMNLAVGDMLTTLLCVPFSFVSQLVLRYWPFGTIMCKMVNYAQAVSVLVSAYTLLAISVDRYTAIMHPLKPRLEMTAAKVVVTMVWIGAFITAAPIPIVSELQRPSLYYQVCELAVCGEHWSTAEYRSWYTIALLVLQFILPLSVLTYTYTHIALVVWCRQPPGEALTDRDLRLRLVKRKMIKMMVTVIFVFTICWLPLNIFIVAWAVYADDVEWSSWPGLQYVWSLSHWLATSHACYNPVIYAYMNPSFRHGFKQVLGNLLCLKMKIGNRRLRSRVCQGAPLFEMLGVNAITTRQQGATGCMMNRITCTHTTNFNKCSTCSSLRRLKILCPPKSGVSTC